MGAWAAGWDWQLHASIYARGSLQRPPPMHSLLPRLGHPRQGAEVVREEANAKEDPHHLHGKVLNLASDVEREWQPEHARQHKGPEANAVIDLVWGEQRDRDPQAPRLPEKDARSALRDRLWPKVWPEGAQKDREDMVCMHAPRKIGANALFVSNDAATRAGHVGHNARDRRVVHDRIAHEVCAGQEVD
eukprot:CAMPEP_0174719608 /NCGR_PEP_ID=MMETSP1094-20130205/31507_1 /TAXON_ID=156173 /ORGANISM="Chrysochromulina brevifilum, Strain UTEX LB 985" /LENGTH=188 /DNA_ID=CAMNT_0015919935 /DNA_START=259 /DNA_END=825 /DNA_ORIENTATION=-